MSAFCCYFFCWGCKSRFASGLTLCHVTLYCFPRDISTPGIEVGDIKESDFHCFISGHAQCAFSAHG